VACYFFPHAVLSNKGVGAKDSLHAVFTANHSVIGIGIGRNCSVIVINANLEIADLLAVHLIVCGVFCVSQYGLLGGPRSAAEAAGPIVGVVLLDER